MREKTSFRRLGAQALLGIAFTGFDFEIDADGAVIADHVIDQKTRDGLPCDGTGDVIGNQIVKEFAFARFVIKPFTFKQKQQPAGGDRIGIAIKPDAIDQFLGGDIGRKRAVYRRFFGDHFAKNIGDLLVGGLAAFGFAANDEVIEIRLIGCLVPAIGTGHHHAKRIPRKALAQRVAHFGQTGG